MEKTCLIVDDSAILRTMVALAVRLSGACVENIIQAANGIDALALLSATQVHLVLTDIHMPEMGGVELLAHMQADAKLAHIPVVIVSAEPSIDRMEDLCRNGARGYLRKPFTPENVRALIVPLLEQQHEDN